MMRGQTGSAKLFLILFLLIILTGALVAAAAFLHHKMKVDAVADLIRSSGLAGKLTYSEIKPSWPINDVVMSNAIINTPGGPIRAGTMTIKNVPTDSRYSKDNLPEKATVIIDSGNISAGVLELYFPDIFTSILHYGNIPVAAGLNFSLDITGEFLQDRAGNAYIEFSMPIKGVGDLAGLVEFKGFYPNPMRNSVKAGVSKARFRYRDKAIVMGFINHVMAHNGITDRREAQKEIIKTIYGDIKTVHDTYGIDFAETPRNLSLMVTQGGGVELAVEFFAPYFFQPYREYQRLGESFAGSVVSAMHQP